MARPKIAVFSGPTSTIANSPSLVTSNKGRNGGDRTLPGRFDHLVAQSLYDPVTVRIKKFSACVYALATLIGTRSAWTPRDL